jgi:hypothetical protein
MQGWLPTLKKVIPWLVLAPPISGELEKCSRQMAIKPEKQPRLNLNFSRDMNIASLIARAEEIFGSNHFLRQNCHHLREFG